MSASHEFIIPRSSRLTIERNDRVTGAPWHLHVRATDGAVVVDLYLGDEDVQLLLAGLLGEIGKIPEGQVWSWVRLLGEAEASPRSPPA